MTLFFTSEALGRPSLQVFGLSTQVSTRKDLDLCHRGSGESVKRGRHFHLTTAIGGETNTIRGGAPYARLAVYKTCWFNKCSCADITKAFDDAIHDNVDIISMSLGQPGTETDFMKDCFSLGALHAFQNGILVTASGGNYAEPYTVSNAAPWILTVAASSINREFISEVELGNGVLVKGFAHNNDHQNSFGTIVTGRSAANEDARPEDASACKWNSLDYSRIQRKVVVCTMENWDDDKVQKSQVIADAGGRGLIIVDPYEYTQTNLGEYRLPTSVVSQEVGDKLADYMGYYRHTALIHDTKVHFRGIKAPRMAYFSSKGPGSAPDIIKPDITAPGLNIFGAWPPSHNPNDRRDEWYNLQSGTSMACPHVSGVAAVLKGIHRKLSPAEVKSAIMTSDFPFLANDFHFLATARTTDRFGEPIQAGERDATPFDFGSGHLRPNDALRAGLVYDFNTNDVIAYLCSAGVSDWQLQNLVGEDASCPHSPVPTYNLNYPSIAVSNMKGPTTVTRTVTYLGRGTDPKKFYLDVEQPEGVNLKVQPDTLDFSDGQRTMTYTVDIQVKKRHKKGKYVFGSITWYNDRHNYVKSSFATVSDYLIVLQGPIGHSQARVSVEKSLSSAPPTWYTSQVEQSFFVSSRNVHHNQRSNNVSV
ncbi:hypothetical protein RJ640_030917 [Escallonia rubra]|uniref:Uncharacterized protein n=1 Tax=Escallonia rubra TaxID=112253 RepID=A0AA88UDK6_9ASTE|nr:hypothetical protein RJ640_030917 [Escallonia rubra]